MFEHSLLQPSTTEGFTHELRFPADLGRHCRIEMVPLHGFNLVGTPEVALEGDEVVAHLVLERNCEECPDPGVPDPYLTFTLASREPATEVAPDHSGLAIGWGEHVQNRLRSDCGGYTEPGESAFGVFGDGPLGVHFPVARDSGRTWPRPLAVDDFLDLTGYSGFGAQLEPGDIQYFSVVDGEVIVELRRLGIWPGYQDDMGFPTTPYDATHLQRDIGQPHVGDRPWRWGSSTEYPSRANFPPKPLHTQGIELVTVERAEPVLDFRGVDHRFWPGDSLHLFTEGNTQYWVTADED